MANQRSKDKKVISVPLPKDVLERIEREAAEKGVDRVKLINEILRKALKLSLVLALLWQFVPESRPALRKVGKAIAAQVAKL